MSYVLLTTKSVSHPAVVSLSSVFVFLLGVALNVYSYGSLEPLVVSVGFFLLGYTLYRLTSKKCNFEQKIFLRIFSIGLFFSGVAAVFGNQLDDQFQLSKDANNYFEVASRVSESYSIFEERRYAEGVLAIKIWHSVYSIAAYLGLELERYIGIFFNVVLVSFTAVIGAKIVKIVYGHDDRKLHIFMWLFSFCGLFGLFSALHLRDAFILFTVTSLGFFFCKFLASRNSLFGLIKLIVLCVCFSIVLEYLRVEFLYLPAALTLAAVGSFVISTFSFKPKAKKYYFMFVVLICGFIVVSFHYSNHLFLMLTEGYAKYSISSQVASEGGSLGYSLVVNQPFLIRLIVGSVYLFFFPVPFWGGFFTGSAYYFFKSINVIFFYFFLPLLVMGIIEILSKKKLRSGPLLFLLVSSIGLALSVSVSTLETRHLGVFLPFIFLVSLSADTSSKRFFSIYRSYLGCMLSLVVLVHFIWIILKFY